MEAFLQVRPRVLDGRSVLGDAPQHPGGRVVVLAEGEQLAQVPLGGRARHQVRVAAGEGQQASVAGLAVLVGAGAVADEEVRAGEQLPDLFRAGEVGEIARAARHGVVQQQRLAVVTAHHWVGARQHPDVVRGPAERLAQAQQNRRRQRRNREQVPEHHRPGQRQQHPLGVQGP